MLQIRGLDQGMEIFKALGSDVRMRIVQMLAENKEMNLNEIAAGLGLTNGAVTAHIRKLEECGIIHVRTDHSGRGVQKMCRLDVDQILLDTSNVLEDSSAKVYETQIRIGHYSDYSVQPRCGLAGDSSLIGTAGDPRVFAYPERVNADLLWLHDGYVEYRIPNLLPENHMIVQLTISFEISSADSGLPGDTRSDIRFSLNGQPLGCWTSDLVQDGARGIYTPVWWTGARCQHGFLKMLVINQMGVYRDGEKIAETGPDWQYFDSSGDMKLRFEAHPENGRSGGIALYGSSFGNYMQNIEVRVHYMPKPRG